MSDFVIDLNRWTYKDYKNYKAALEADELETASNIAANAIVSWPFDKVVSGESIMSLGFSDMMAVFRAVGKSLKKSFSEGE